MKRLVKINEKYQPQVGDHVIFKNHPYDFETYVVTDILANGTVMMENNDGAYVGISPLKIKFLY